MLLFSKPTRIPAGLSAIAVAFLLNLAPSTYADVIVSSLNNTSSFVNFSIGAWAGSPFRTDSQTWTLTSASVSLDLGAETLSTANVRLMSDSGGKPGATLADLGTQNVTNGAARYTFTAPTTVTLAATNTYWIVVGNVGTNGGLNVALFQQGGTFTNTAVPGASMANSISSGSTVSQTVPTNWTASTPGISLLFAVEGTTNGGTNTNTTSPVLNLVRLDATRVQLTWPTNFTGFSLQISTNLLATNTVWTRFAATPTVTNDQYSLLFSNSAPRTFYRLTKP